MMSPILQAFLAAAAAFLLVLVLLSVLSLLIRLHRKASTPPPHHHHHHYRRHLSPPRRLPSFPEEECHSFEPSLSLSLPLLSSATNDFHPSLVVGDGSFGLVYKAVLPNGGPTLAVKRLSPDSAPFSGLREFRAEIETLGHLRHPNLCRFLGYCSSGPHLRLLVYEFLPYGSLDFWLHESPPSPPLPFPTRLRAVRGVASGLSYLHHECFPPVIHRDIKSSNVLLDHAFAARIADFGLARELEVSRSHVSTQVAGTMGYMPPEYREGLMVATVKADVYSFGVLMLEVVTGRRPNLPVAVEEEAGRRREVGLVTWARRMVAEGREREMVEKGMGGAEEEALVKAYVAVAVMCTGDVVRHRPSMENVVHLLDEVAASAPSFDPLLTLV